MLAGSMKKMTDAFSELFIESGTLINDCMADTIKIII